jgi:hypothetical protein
MFMGLALLFVAFSFAITLLVYAFLGEHRLEIMAGAVRENAGTVALIGIACFVALFALHGFGFVHIPFISPLAALVMFILTVIGFAGVSILIGDRMAGDSAPFARVLLGAFIIALLNAIPLVNFIAIPVFSLLAVGAAALTGLGTSTRWLDDRLRPRAAAAGR